MRTSVGTARPTQTRITTNTQLLLEATKHKKQQSWARPNKTMHPASLLNLFEATIRPLNVPSPHRTRQDQPMSQEQAARYFCTTPDQVEIFESDSKLYWICLETGEMAQVFQE